MPLEGHPFASITWIRFDGSLALPHKTLSLRPRIETGWLPVLQPKTRTASHSRQERQMPPRTILLELRQLSFELLAELLQAILIETDDLIYDSAGMIDEEQSG